MNAAGGLSTAVFGLAFTVLAARVLPVAQLGAFFEAVAIFSVSIVVAQAGGSAVVVKLVAEAHATGRVSEVPSTIAAGLMPAALFGLLIAVAIIGFAPTLSPLLAKGADSHVTTTYLRTVALFIPFGATLQILLASTRGAGLMWPTVLIDSVAKPGLRVLFASLASVAAMSALVFTALWGMPLVLGTIAAGIIVARGIERSLGTSLLKQAPSRRELRATFGRFARFSSPLWLAEILQLSVLWLDIVLVGALRSSTEAGIYAAVSRVAMVGTLGLAAVVLLLAPEFSAQFSRGQRAALQLLYRRATLWLALASAPWFILLALFSPVILRIFGDDFDTGATTLAILSAGMLASVIAGPASLVLMMGGRGHYVLGNTAVEFGLNIGLNFILIPRFGIAGAGLAWTLSILVGNALPLIQMHRVWQLHLVSWNIATSSAGALLTFGVAGFFSMFLRGLTIEALALAALLGTALYGAFLWLFRQRFELSTLLQTMRVPRLAPNREVG
jgi:O-antigen/teichoic acid export membrane protein